MKTHGHQAGSPSAIPVAPGLVSCGSPARAALLRWASDQALNGLVVQGDGGALARRADGDLRGKQTPVTSSPRPANSDGAQSPELSGRGPFAVRELAL